VSQATPILFLSDAVSTRTGLGRITRDLCALLSRSPKWRVGSFGLGGNTSRHLPWQQYTIDESRGEWGSGQIEEVWTDFAGRERGVVFTIFDATRLLWLSRPEYCGDPQLQRFLTQGHFQLWGYVPIDATGPHDHLSQMAVDSLRGFHKLLAYTKWGEGVIQRSLSPQEALMRSLTWLPHGLDGKMWILRDKLEARRRFWPLLHEGEKLIGVISTNQARKDWGLVAAACEQIRLRNANVKFWFHADIPERHWSIPALLSDFSLGGCTQVTYQMTNEELSWAYSACDLTLHPGSEGFGFPIFESLASGCAVLHGDYAGGADVLRQCSPPNVEKMLVEWEGLRTEGIHNSVRAVYDPLRWAQQALELLGMEHDREGLRASVAHLMWENLWPSCWERYFTEGLKTL
jgi:glycosyltransferase involved in cell wall biosynthesis